MKNFYYILFGLLMLAGCKSQEGATSSPEVKPGRSSGLTDIQQAEVTNLFFNASKEKILGNLNKAAEIYAEVIRRDGSNAAAMYELAGIYTAQKKYNDALFFSKSAWSIDKKNAWYALTYADILQKNKRFSEAADVLEQLVRDYPDRTDYYFELASALVYADKPMDAVKVFDRLEQRIGITKEVISQKSRLYQRMDKNALAVSELQKLINMNPSDPQPYGMLAEVYRAMGENEKALETYNKILEIDPGNPFVHLSLADFYRSNGDKEKSFDELKKSFQNEDLDIETKISILISYFQLIELHPELKSQAMEMCSLLVASHPNEARAHAVYGDFLNLDQKTEDARREYRRALELGSSDFIVYNQVMFLDAQLQDWDALLKDSEAALELFPDQPLVYFYNGIAGLQLKRYDSAIEVLNAGVKMVVDNTGLESQFYASLGEAYNEVKNFEKSDENYEKALALDSNNANTLNNYAYFLSLRGEKLDKAEKMSKLSNELEASQPSYQDTYGWIMYKLGKYNEAKEWIRKSLDNSTEKSATVLEHFGDVLFKLGDTAGALEYWQKAKDAGTGYSEFLDRKLIEKKMVE